MIKREELAEAIKDFIPEGDLGNDMIARIMAVDTYPDVSTDPGPDYVKKADYDRLKEIHNAEIRRLFGIPQPKADEGTAESVPAEGAGDGEVVEAEKAEGAVVTTGTETVTESVLTDATTEDPEVFTLEALLKAPEIGKEAK